MNDVTVLVNTSDGFADCWQPFFKLFSTFWPDCPYPIVLNTETLDYSFEGVELRTVKPRQVQVVTLAQLRRAYPDLWDSLVARGDRS